MFDENVSNDLKTNLIESNNDACSIDNHISLNTNLLEESAKTKQYNTYNNLNDINVSNQVNSDIQANSQKNTSDDKKIKDNILLKPMHYKTKEKMVVKGMAFLLQQV